MKTIVSASLMAGCLVATSNAQAARLAVTTNGNTATVYLKAGKGTENGGDLNDKFDTVDFEFTPGPATLINITSGAGPRPPGEPFTYRNRLLDADPLDGGLGWSIVGQTINAKMAVWAGGPLGGTINTGPADGPGLFLQNLSFSSQGSTPSGALRVQLIRAGTVVAVMDIPEPSSFAMASAAAVLVLRRRRRSFGDPSPGTID